MSGDLEAVMHTAQVFEASKTAVAASVELGVCMKTIYNHLETLEGIIGTKQLKKDFPKIWTTRHAKRGPKKLNCDYPDHFIDAPDTQPDLSPEALAKPKKKTGKPMGRPKTPPGGRVPASTANNVRSVLSDVRRRVQTKHSAPARPKVGYTDDELKSVVSEKLAQAIFYIDSETLGRAKLSELSQMFKTLFEAKQLLDGRPTTILSRGDKDDLEKLVPRLLAEAKKRGFSFKKDVTGELIEDGEKKDLKTSKAR